MPRSRRSIYRLHDVMIAVAFTAIALAWVQAEWAGMRLLADWIPGRSYRPLIPLIGHPLYRSVRSTVATGVYAATAVASPWAVYLLYRSRRPGRVWRFGRIRRPGAIACLAVTVVLSLELIHATVGLKRGPRRLEVTSHTEPRRAVSIRHLSLPRLSLPPVSRGQTTDPFFDMLDGMSRHAGLVVAGAWLTLRCAGAWRPEPTWVDRAGRTLGILWLLATFFVLCVP